MWFNLDYELKATPGARPQPWQETPDGRMPHVHIPIEVGVTAIVGAITHEGDLDRVEKMSPA